MDEMMAIPAREVSTPRSLRSVNCSTWVMAPMKRVQMPWESISAVAAKLCQGHSLLVEVSIVALATVV